MNLSRSAPVQIEVRRPPFDGETAPAAGVPMLRKAVRPWVDLRLDRRNSRCPGHPGHRTGMRQQAGTRPTLNADAFASDGLVAVFAGGGAPLFTLGWVMQDLRHGLAFASP